MLEQTISDLECIVVDDAGTIEATVPDDSRVRCVRHATNAGPGACRNTGVEHARGKYVTFLDDDDVYVPERLSLALGALERAPLALCWGVWMGTEHPTGRRLEGRVYDVILDQITPHISTVTLARTDFEPFDGSYQAAEDAEWFLRMTQRYSVSTDERVGVLLRQHDAPRHGSPRSARIEASRRMLTDYRDYFATHRRAHAFRWTRIGLLALSDGRRGEAARAFVRSLRIRPELRPLWYLTRTALPDRIRR